MPSPPPFQLADFVIKVVQQLGFPIFVSVWLLVQGNRQHAANLAVLRAMDTQLTTMATTLNVLVQFIRDGIHETPRHEG